MAAAFRVRCGSSGIGSATNHLWWKRGSRFLRLPTSSNSYTAGERGRQRRPERGLFIPSGHAVLTRTAASPAIWFGNSRPARTGSRTAPVARACGEPHRDHFVDVPECGHVTQSVPCSLPRGRRRLRGRPHDSIELGANSARRQLQVSWLDDRPSAGASTLLLLVQGVSLPSSCTSSLRFAAPAPEVVIGFRSGGGSPAESNIADCRPMI